MDLVKLVVRSASDGLMDDLEGTIKTSSKVKASLNIS